MVWIEADSDFEARFLVLEEYYMASRDNGFIFQHESCAIIATVANVTSVFQQRPDRGVDEKRARLLRYYLMKRQAHDDFLHEESYSQHVFPPLVCYHAQFLATRGGDTQEVKCIAGVLEGVGNETVLVGEKPGLYNNFGAI